MKLLGSQRPRVSSIPPYSTSAGQEAVDLAASAGLILDDWQQWVLMQSLGERDSDGNWSAFEIGLIVPRQNGKGSVLEARELFGLVLAKEPVIVHSAHLFKTSKEAMRRILQLFQNTTDLDRKIRKVTTQRGEECIELTNGCRLNFIARSKSGGRGLSGDLLVLDEAFALTDDHMEALMPIMSARQNAQIWYTTSPPLDAITGEVLFGIKDRGETGTDPALAWMDWGHDPGVDQADPAIWAAANPAYGNRITHEAVEREHRTLTAEGFGRERLGIWPVRRKDALLNPEQWRALVDVDSQALDPVAFAVDITPMRDWASIVAYGLRADGLGHVVVVEHRPGTNWLLERILQLREKHNPVAICLDPAGPGANLLLDLEKSGITRPEDPEKPELGDLAVPTGREYAGACGALVDAVKNATLRHIDQVPLASAIDGVKTRPLGDAWAWGRRAGNVDISPLVAATLARWAFEARAHLITDDHYDLLDSVL